MLEDVLNGTVFPRLYNAGRLDMRYLPRRQEHDETCVKIEDILAQPSEHIVHDHYVHLSPSERFDLMLCTDEGRKLVYLAELSESSIDSK